MCTRRELITTGLKTGIALGAAGIVGQAENAMAKVHSPNDHRPHTTIDPWTQAEERRKKQEQQQNKPKEKYEMPSAIEKASELERRAWLAWHIDRNQGKALEYLNQKRNLQTTSPIYHLLRRKMGVPHPENELKEMLFQSNPGLFYYAMGTNELFNKNNTAARSHYATGMMISANLTETDYQKIRNQGIIVTRTGNSHNDAYNLGQKFIEAPIEQKLIIDRIIADNLAQSSMKELFWNLGFFPHAEFNITEKNQAYINEFETYKKLYKKNNYHTFSNALKRE